MHNHIIQLSECGHRWQADMRFLIAVVLFLAAAGVADAFFLDGENARAVWQAASDEGQQIRYALDSFMTKRLFH